MKITKQYIGLMLLMLLMVSLPTYSASEANFVKLYKTYTLNADGSSEERVYKELKIFTHAAMNGKYGESFIVYNPEYQELKINDSYTVQKNGNIVRTPENAFVEVLPSVAANAPAYNHLKEMVVVHTGLELGATIVLDYSIISKGGRTGELDIFSPVKELSPISDFTFTVNVPESKTLHYELLNSNVRPSVKVKNGVKTVTYKMKNVQASPYQYPCYSLPVVQQVASGMMPVVVANTYKNFDVALSVLESQMKVGDKKVIDNKIAEFKEKVGDDKQNLRDAIGEFMSYLYSRNGFVKVSLQESGYRIRPASEVLKSMYGTQAELANLDVALQKAAGIDAEIKICSVKLEDANYGGLAGIVGVLADSELTPMKVALINEPYCNFAEYINTTTLKGEQCTLNSVKSSSSAVSDNLQNLEFTADNSKEIPGGYTVMTLPNQMAASLYYSYSANTTIQENILLPSKFNFSNETKVKLPEGKVWMKKSDVSVSNKIGEVSFKYVEEDGVIKVTRKLKINEQLITVSDYKLFYSLMSEWKDVNNHTIVVR